MALTAMTLDDTVVVPPAPDPFDCSISKRKWNKVMPPWKYEPDATRLVEWYELCQIHTIQVMWW